MIWEKIDIDKNEVLNIASRYRIDPLIASILVRRDIKTPEEIKFFLEDDSRYLHNSFLFKDMEDVVDRIHSAIDEEERVLVFGDKDVDGVTSTVILYESLKSIDIDITWKVPQGDDGYGLSVDSVNEAYDNNISLIFTVDCGISAFDALTRAKEVGIDVVILDHHNQRDNLLPDATYIINPKLDGCEYPFKGLAACGVVSKVLWALCFSFIDTIYKSSMTFLHTEKSEEGIVVTAAKLYNLCEVDRISFNIEAEDFNRDSLVGFLQGEQILVYGEESQKENFKVIFGSGIDVNVIDVKPEVERILSGISGVPLSRLLELSRVKVYTNNTFNEIDLILNLFITYVDRRYADKFDLFTNSLDLVALGTVADLMPLRGENRILINRGLKMLSSSKREGLQSLLLQQNLIGKDITSKDISWVIAPVINSAGRMRKANVAVELLLCEDPNLKNKYTLDILAINKERKALSESLWASLYNGMHESYEDLNNKLVIIFDDDMQKGVTGIIASRIVSTFSVPGIVLAREGEYISGSIRSSGDLNIKILLGKLSDILIDWGGHKCAAGFKMKFSNLNKFKSEVKKMILGGKVLEKSVTKKETLTVDANIPKEYLDTDIINIYDKFEPFGEKNSPLNLVTKEVKIIDINFMGKVEKKHLRMLVEIGEMKWPALFWNAAERVGRDFTKGDVVNLLYRVERNFFGGNETLQLNILDILK